MTSLVTDFYTDFAWCVPKFFADAMSICRFEEGDILYSSQEGYNPWIGGICPAPYYLQVISPPRNSSTGRRTDAQERENPGEDTEPREVAFAKNWHSPVVFTWHDVACGEQRRMTTTQGALYTLLWTGESLSDPPMPLTARALTIDALTVATRYFRAQAADGYVDAVLFLLPYDRTLPLLRDKFDRILAGVRKLDTAHLIASPSDAGVKSRVPFLPTVRIACIYFCGSIRDDIAALLKFLLYKKKPDAKFERFSLAKHGLLSGISTDHEQRDDALREKPLYSPPIPDEADTSTVFWIQGDAPHPYKVQFWRIGDNVTSSCNCAAGLFKTICRHRLNLLLGDITCMLDTSPHDIHQLFALLRGTDVEYALQVYNDDPGEDNLRDLKASLKD